MDAEKPDYTTGPPPLLRVLITEDMPRDAKLVASVLERAGYRVQFEVTDSVEVFLEHLETIEYDVILADFNLRNWTALDALEILKQRGKDIPLIVVTGTLGDEAAVECIKQGAADFVLKDRLARLPAAVQHTLEEKRLREERKRAEESLRESEERFRATFENAGVGMALLDMQGRPVKSNPALRRILGYSEEELIRTTLNEVTHPDDRELGGWLYSELAAGKRDKYEMEKRYLTKGGDVVWGLTTTSLVKDRQGRPVCAVGMLQDITERKRLELQLRQAQKMEAVGRLAGGVAHDFNNLLTIINGFAALLSRQTSAEDPRHEQLKEILTAGETAASLTRQLLAFSRRQLLEPRVLGLNSVVADIENMLRHLIGEDVELVTTLQPDLGRVKVDPGQIEQVIMNLVVNARDAMPQGGKLLIETSDVEIDEDYVRSHAPMLPGKYVMMAVSDTGCGMDLETQAHIFEPFFTTKEEGRGTGLGLATVYGIVKQSGGFIWVYSEPGRGSTFKIYFPRVEEVLPTAKTVKVRAQRVEGSKTVLVVEDEAGVRSLVCQALAAHGYKVLEAAGAARALKISKQHTQPIDLLLTDVVMPRTSGKELAKRLSSLHPETKVLYMSGYTDDAVVRLGLSEGGTPFLQKPFGPDALLLKVHEVLEMKP